MIQEHTLVPTKNYEKMKRYSDYAREKKKLVMFIAQNGYGKTSFLTNYRDTNPGSLYFRVGKGEPAKRFYSRFLSDIDPNEIQDVNKLMKKSYIYYLMDSASYIINERSDINLIMIDEFGNFNKRYVSYIRQIWDDIKYNSGMILAGPPSVLKSLMKWQKEGEQGINELMSRVGPNRFIFKKSDRADIKLICESRGINSSKEINFFYKNSPDLRILHALLDNYKEAELVIV